MQNVHFAHSNVRCRHFSRTYGSPQSRVCVTLQRCSVESFPFTDACHANAGVCSKQEWCTWSGLHPGLIEQIQDSKLSAIIAFVWQAAQRTPANSKSTVDATGAFLCPDTS